MFKKMIILQLVKNYNFLIGAFDLFTIVGFWGFGVLIFRGGGQEDIMLQLWMQYDNE